MNSFTKFSETPSLKTKLNSRWILLKNWNNFLWKSTWTTTWNFEFLNFQESQADSYLEIWTLKRTWTEGEGSKNSRFKFQVYSVFWWQFMMIWIHVMLFHRLVVSRFILIWRRLKDIFDENDIIARHIELDEYAWVDHHSLLSWK